MSAEQRIAAATEQARQELIAATDALRPLVGLEAEYPHLVYDRMKKMKYALGRLDGLRLARDIVQEGTP